MIGIGMQGSGLLTNSIELPEWNAASACDLYDGRHTWPRRLSAPIYLPPGAITNCWRTRTLIDRRRRSGPLAQTDWWWNAVSAGKDIYIENRCPIPPPRAVEMARQQ